MRSPTTANYQLFSSSIDKWRHVATTFCIQADTQQALTYLYHRYTSTLYTFSYHKDCQQICAKFIWNKSYILMPSYKFVLKRMQRRFEHRSLHEHPGWQPSVVVLWWPKFKNTLKNISYIKLHTGTYENSNVRNSRDFPIAEALDFLWPSWLWKWNDKAWHNDSEIRYNCQFQTTSWYNCSPNMYLDN